MFLSHLLTFLLRKDIMEKGAFPHIQEHGHIFHLFLSHKVRAMSVFMVLGLLSVLSSQFCLALKVGSRHAYENAERILNELLAFTGLRKKNARQIKGIGRCQGALASGK